MAKTVSEWKKIITDVFISFDVVKSAYQLEDGKTFEDEFSVSSLESILFYCVAYCANFLESIVEMLFGQIIDYISNMKPHSLKWYAGKFTDYQHGFSLLPDSDKYDNTGKTADQIAASKIVKYSAVNEQANEYGRVSLRIKLATVSGGDLAPLNQEQLQGAKEYGLRVKDAGVPLIIDSLPPDSLKMVWTIYYDPLILNNQGNRLDGTGTNVIETAIKEYLKALPFNGTFALAFVTDAVQKVAGVVIPKPDLAQYKYGNLDWQNIDTWIIPDAGYLRFNDAADLIINYIAQSEIR